MKYLELSILHDSWTTSKPVAGSPGNDILGRLNQIEDAAAYIAKDLNEENYIPPVCRMIQLALEIDRIINPAGTNQETIAKAKSIMAEKNNDYRGGEEDPFANFKRAVRLGVEPEILCLARLIDKVQRIRTFEVSGKLAVKGETVDDAVWDIINYSVLCGAMLLERRRRWVELMNVFDPPPDTLTIDDARDDGYSDDDGPAPTFEVVRY